VANKVISRALQMASQNVNDDRLVGLPHEQNLVSGYSNDPKFVGSSDMAPPVDVSFESGEWREYGADGLQLIDGGIEQPIGAERKAVDIEVGKDSYRTAKVGLEAYVYDEEQETEDYDVIRDRKIQRVSTGIQLYAEYLVSRVVQNTSNFDAGFKVTLAGTSRWTDYVNSNPTADIQTGLLALEDTHEVDRPDFVVALPMDVWIVLSNHPKVQQPIPGTGLSQQPSLEYLAKLWNVKEVKLLFGKYSYNVGDKKDPRNWRFKRLWTNCFVIYRPITKPNPDSPLWMARPHRKGFPKVPPPYRDWKKDADAYAVTDKFGVLLRAKNRAYYGERVIG
jgi:hypothetical protein